MHFCCRKKKVVISSLCFPRLLRSVWQQFDNESNARNHFASRYLSLDWFDAKKIDYLRKKNLQKFGKFRMIVIDETFLIIFRQLPVSMVFTINMNLKKLINLWRNTINKWQRNWNESERQREPNIDQFDVENLPFALHINRRAICCCSWMHEREGVCEVEWGK